MVDILSRFLVVLDSEVPLVISDSECGLKVQHIYAS